MNRVPVGALCIAHWIGNTEEWEVWISLGTYDEETDCDSFGRADDTIFYYCADEAELIELTKPEGNTEFRLISYDIEFEDEVVV